jgi:hypothetical protein
VGGRNLEMRDGGHAIDEILVILGVPVESDPNLVAEPPVVPSGSDQLTRSGGRRAGIQRRRAPLTLTSPQVPQIGSAMYRLAAQRCSGTFPAIPTQNGEPRH